jgi:hypothetical protein
MFSCVSTSVECWSKVRARSAEKITHGVPTCGECLPGQQHRVGLQLELASASGQITAVSTHNTGTDANDGGLTVQLYPFLDTPNPGGVYKAWVTPLDVYLGRVGNAGLIAVPVAATCIAKNGSIRLLTIGLTVMRLSRGIRVRLTDCSSCPPSPPWWNCYSLDALLVRTDAGTVTAERNRMRRSWQSSINPWRCVR